MKLTGLILTIFICCNVSAQGLNNDRIEIKTRKQLLDTGRFEPTKIIPGEQNDALSVPYNKKNSRFRLNLNTAATTDLVFIYTRKKYELAISIEDLFNVDWSNGELSAKSRLRDEPTPVEEIDFGSGIQFLARFKLSFSL